MIGKPSSPVRREAARKRTSPTAGTSLRGRPILVDHESQEKRPRLRAAHFPQRGPHHLDLHHPHGPPPHPPSPTTAHHATPRRTGESGPQAQAHTPPDAAATDDPTGPHHLALTAVTGGRAGSEALGGSDELADHHRPGVSDYTEAPQVLL